MFKCKYNKRKCITTHMLVKIVKLNMHEMFIKILILYLPIFLLFQNIIGFKLKCETSDD